MEFLGIAISIGIFLLVLVALILVHEWGHFFSAKKLGMRVDEFGVGLPPKVWSTQKGETEYSINALPIGGFVRIFGQDLDTDPADPEYERAFVARPKWAQAVVLAAGVIMNVLFAWLLFSVAFMIGVPSAVEERAASESAALTITSVLPESPAAAAEIPIGAEVTAVSSGDASLTALTPSTFTEFVAKRSAQPITVTYMAAGDVEEVTLTPSAGVIEGEGDRPAVGVALALIEMEQKSFLTALYDGLLYTGSSLVAITVGLYDLITGSVTGSADLSQVAGPVGIVGLVGDAAEFGFTSLLMFTAIISLNLAIINLLPVPALDGGRLVMVAIETVKGTPIPAEWAVRVNTVGFVLLILLMLAVTFNDILRLL